MDRVGWPMAETDQANPVHLCLQNGSGVSDEGMEAASCPGRLEKPLSVLVGVGSPYRTPTLVGRGKCPKVDERSSVKELGKLTP
jgi:hypothetical protein